MHTTLEYILLARRMFVILNSATSRVFIES